MVEDGGAVGAFLRVVGECAGVDEGERDGNEPPTYSPAEPWEPRRIEKRTQQDQAQYSCLLNLININYSVACFLDF